MARGSRRCVGDSDWCFASWGSTEHPPGTAHRSLRDPRAPLTSYPGMEGARSLSPDGSQVAFSWNGEAEDNFDIYVKLVGPGQPWRLTANPARDKTAIMVARMGASSPSTGRSTRAPPTWS